MSENVVYLHGQPKPIGRFMGNVSSANSCMTNRPS
jgi:hypothetical protein